MAYVGGGRGMGILKYRSPFQLGAYTDDQVEAVLRSFPYSAVRITSEAEGRTIIANGTSQWNEQVIGTMADVAAAHAAFDKLGVKKFAAGTPVPGSSDPKTQEQLAVIRAWQQQDVTGKEGEVTPGDFGNVNPKYANYAIGPDGSVYPDASSVMTIPATRTDIQAQLNAHRYVFLLNTDGIPVSYIGAVSPTAAQAILATYTPGVAAPTAAQQAARTVAEQQAKTEAVTVQAANVPAVSSTVVSRIVDEATDQGGNIPPDGEVFVIPAGSGGGATTGGGSYVPAPDGGGSETAVPASGATPVLLAGISSLTDTQKGLLAGAAVVAAFLFTRRGK